ncbi:MAG: tRNA pseudouridine(55) synthase TruB [Geobacter sp.]|nr:tRNA pseudouridine(55) synthase TruB [Geobacter sp.]
MDGFIVVDKPAGMTSHGVVAAVRRMLGQKKAGHTGTLDPFATGVLPVALGEGTKAIPFLDEGEKGYRAVMRLGITTDTQDYTGTVLREIDWQQISPEEVKLACSGFVGRIMQVPPMFSALKRDGVPLYKLARRGEEVEREPRQVDIMSLDILGIDLPLVTFEVRCSRGTYVRTLAHDIGEALGCGACLTELRRTMSGPFTLPDAITLDQLEQATHAATVDEMILSPHAALAHLQDFTLSPDAVRRIANGIAPVWDDVEEAPEDAGADPRLVRLSRDGNLVAVAEAVGGERKTFRLVRVFHQVSALQ